LKERNFSKQGYVGYGAPPQHSRFKVGNREHLKRRKKTKPDIADDVRSFLKETIGYQENRKPKRGRRIDVQLLKIKTAALNGDLSAAESLIDMRENPGKFAKFTKKILVLHEEDAFL
jgi:hypothetical protein